MKSTVLITGLVVILFANLLMMYYRPYGMSPMERFQNATSYDNSAGMNTSANAAAANAAAANAAAVNAAAANVASANAAAANAAVVANAAAVNSAAANAAAANAAAANAPMLEGFSSYNLASAGGAKQVYKPMGQFDGVKLSTGNTISDWRYTAPNEPLTGPEFEPGDDSLFMFKNNQCKPECCGASFSCGGGCVCTTPQQRQYIAGRGGNRNAPEDSA